MTTSTAPTITRLLDASGKAYGMLGWAEFERWAGSESDAFRTVDAACRREGFSELERLKQLVYVFVVDGCEAQRARRGRAPTR